MKVFVVPTWHPTERRPLWANWVLPHIDLLRDAGFDVYVLQVGLDFENYVVDHGPEGWNHEPTLITDSHLYVPAPRPSAPWRRLAFIYGCWLRKYEVKLQQLFNIAIQMWGEPDVVHAHVSLPGGLASARIAKKYGIPCVVQEHYSGFISDTKYFWRRGMYFKELGRLTPHVYAVSPGFARTISNSGVFKVKGVLPNPIDTELFQPSSESSNSDFFEIVTAGGLSGRKGSDTLLEAFRLLPKSLNARLTILGDASKSEDYKVWLSDPNLTDRVLLKGLVSQEEMRRVFGRSHVYVVSSRVETANVSMLQALACGVPLVTTACGAPETLINSSVGRSVPVSNPSAMAAAIVDVAENFEQFSPRSLRHFVEEHYSKDAVRRQVEFAYNIAVDSRLGA